MVENKCQFCCAPSFPSAFPHQHTPSPHLHPHTQPSGLLPAPSAPPRTHTLTHHPSQPQWQTTSQSAVRVCLVNTLVEGAVTHTVHVHSSHSLGKKLSASEPHDLPSESHDPPSESHDLPSESHDLPSESHDFSDTSHLDDLPLR